MLIVSFCDIVTITTAALFFAMLITIQTAIKIPVLRPTPRAVPTDKRPVFFECRNGEVFFVDKAGLDDAVEKLLATATPGRHGNDPLQALQALQRQPVANAYYRVNPRYFLQALLALEPLPEVHGETLEQLEDPHRIFQKTLARLDQKKQYLAFLVRDDSFVVYRRARSIATRLGFDTGWELLDAAEPIVFGPGGVPIPPT